MAARKTFKGTRFTWGMADQLITAIQPILVAEDLFFGGSYIRKQVTVGDIDLAILPKEGTIHSLSELVAAWKGEYLVKGASLMRVILTPPASVGMPEGFRFQLDIWMCFDRGSWGGMCMFVAGSGRLNVQQRVKASAQGYTLSQYGLARGGEKLHNFPTEQSVYDFLGWPWLPYEKRSLG